MIADPKLSGGLHGHRAHPDHVYLDPRPDIHKHMFCWSTLTNLDGMFVVGFPTHIRWSCSHLLASATIHDLEPYDCREGRIVRIWANGCDDDTPGVAQRGGVSSKEKAEPCPERDLVED